MLGPFYRTPNELSDFIDLFQESLERAFVDNKEMISMGDFNYDFLSKFPSGDRKKLKDLFKNMGLLQLISKNRQGLKEPLSSYWTFFTVLIHTMLLLPQRYHPLRDHNSIILVRKINGLRQKPRLINCRNYASYNPTLFHDDLEAASWDEVLALEDVKEAWLARTPRGLLQLFSTMSSHRDSLSVLMRLLTEANDSVEEWKENSRRMEKGPDSWRKRAFEAEKKCIATDL